MAERAVADSELDALLEQRDHLLASLDDLEREREAGDIDDVDYATLKDDYTARAAATIRTIDARRALVPATRRGSRRLFWIAGIAAIAIASGVFIAQASGSRRAGEFGSGEIRSSTPTLLLRAQDELQNGRFDEAIDIYDEVLDVEPANVEALTYRAWVRYRRDQIPDDVLPDFAEAVALDPDYPDARVFNAIVLLDDDQPLAAAEQLKAFDATDPPPFMINLVASRSLRENIMGALFSGDSPMPISATAFSTDDVVAVARSLADSFAPVEAQTLFDAVLRDEPDNAEAHTYAGWMLAQLSTTPAFTESLDEQGVADLVSSAFVFLDRAIELDPSYPDPFAWRAFFRREHNDIAGARADLEAFYALEDLPPDILALITKFSLDDVLSEDSEDSEE